MESFMAKCKTQSRRNHRTVLNWSVLAASAAFSLPASAQADAAPAAAPVASGAAPSRPAAPDDIQRVEVTAGKRKQLQSEVAGTVTAISGAKMEQLGTVDAEDLFKLSPGVQFSKDNADGAMISIRGIGTNTVSDNVVFGQSPTGLYIEDVPVTDPYVYISTPDVVPFDLERVEVLRGPQGALYGSASLGGAVRYLYAKPDLRQDAFSVLTGLSSVSHGGSGYNVDTMANLVLSHDVAGLRVVVAKRKDPGYIDNVKTGKNDINANVAESARVILALKPARDLDLTATYSVQQSKQGGDGGVSPSSDELTIAAPTDARILSKFSLTSVQANWEVAGLRLTSLSGYTTKVRNQDNDLSYLLVPDFTVYGGVNAPGVDRALNVERRDSHAFTQEIRLAPVTPGALSWLVGAFHQRATFFRSELVTLPGADDPENLPDDIYFQTARHGVATENSVFADLDWKVTPQWSLGAGARYFRTQVDFARSNFGAPYTEFDSKESGTTPKFSTRYQFTPEVSAYATASRGYRYGGINTVGSLPYKSDSLWNYETGLRMQPSREVSLDLSVFMLDWKNIQMSTTNTDGFVLVTNAAKARSTGFEAALGWRPAQDFSLDASLALTAARLGAEFVSASGRVVASGTELAGVAKVQSSLNATYRFTGPLQSSAAFSTVLQYVGKRQAQIDAGLELPAYTTADLRLALGWSNWELTGFVQNVADRRGQSSAQVNYSSYQNPGAINFTEWYPIKPRTIGVSLRYDY
jgi:iron complex outermembrane recepter protein